MTTSRRYSNSVRRLICCGSVLAICALAFQARASAAPSDVTAVVNEGTLEITKATNGESTFIRIEGGLTDDISIFVREVLLDTFPRSGISAIDVDANQSVVSLGQSTLFEFEGDIAVDVRTGGRCSLTLDMTGKLFLTGSSGGINVEYRRAYVEGDVTVIGGPGGDQVSRTPFGGGELFVDGDLHIDGGPGDEYIELQSAFVSGDTLIDLGQSSSGNDTDYCGLFQGHFCGNVIIAGDEGDDAVDVGAPGFGSPTIGGNLLVDLGNGADRIWIYGLTLLPCPHDQPKPLVFLDGGNGNSDELLSSFPLLPEEYTGFETVNTP